MEEKIKQQDVRILKLINKKEYDQSNKKLKPNESKHLYLQF